jgi:hypothetical protein
MSAAESTVRPVDVYCLDPSDHVDLLETIATVAQPLLNTLLQHELRNYCANPNVALSSAACLVHYAEGRTLLLDADGLYNAFLATTISRYNGNVFFILSGIDCATPRNALCNIDTVGDLIEGGQVSIAALCDAGRFFTCSESLNDTQLHQLSNGLTNKLQPLSLPHGVLNWSASKTQAKSSEEGGFRCMLL